MSDLTKQQCACVNDDARMCIAIRYNLAYDRGESDESVLDDDECECSCHAPDPDFVDAVEQWIEENKS